MKLEGNLEQRAIKNNKSIDGEWLLENETKEFDELFSDNPPLQVDDDNPFSMDNPPLEISDDEIIKNNEELQAMFNDFDNQIKGFGEGTKRTK